MPSIDGDAFVQFWAHAVVKHVGGLWICLAADAMSTRSMVVGERLD